MSHKIIELVLSERPEVSTPEYFSVNVSHNQSCLQLAWNESCRLGSCPSCMSLLKSVYVKMNSRFLAMNIKKGFIYSGCTDERFWHDHYTNAIEKF